MTHFMEFNTAEAIPATTSLDLLFCTGFGQYDTRKGKSEHYTGITGNEIVAMLSNPPSVPKAQAQWFIPSTYKASDGREFDVQRERGEYWFLALDEDGETTNNLTLDEIDETLAKVLGPVARMIYSTRSSTEAKRKWRALIPLASPISGPDYEDTQVAFNAALIKASAGVLIPDPALERSAQLIYLPNRGEHYEHRLHKLDRLDLSANHPIIIKRDAISEQRRKAEAEARKRREARRERAQADPTGGASVIEAFNASTTVEAELERFGYQRSRNGKDWKSPNSSTGSFAVRNFGDFWFSFSGSDDSADIGQRGGGGRIGDAFDLFQHYEHGGDGKTAVREAAKMFDMDHASRPAQTFTFKIDTGQDEAKPFFKRGSDLAGLPVPAREWLVQDLIPMKTVTLLSGDGGTGKSLLALQLAIAAATGGTWLGLPIKTGKTITLSAEDDDEELHRRQFDIVRAQNISLASLSDFNYRSMAGEDALLAHLDPSGKLHPTPLYHQIDAAMGEEKPVLLVLDTSADLFPGNENDRAQVRQFIGMLKRLALRHSCAVVLLSHPSLTGINSGSGLSGSTAWNNSVRSRLYMERVVLKEGLQTIEDDPDRRVLSGKKANHARNGSQIHMSWKEGVFVAEEAATGLDAMAADNKAERVFLRLLDEYASEGRFVKSANAVGNAAKAFANSGRSEGVSKPQLHSAMERLFANGKIVEVMGGDGPPSKHTKRIVRAF